jgi:flagellar biosynthesis/type III secretory pathway protein FliH
LTLAKGRLVRGSASLGAKPIAPSGSAQPYGRIVQRAAAEAARDAADRLARAEHAARALLEQAEQTACKLRDEARQAGRQEGAAELAAAWIKLRAEENARHEKDLDRTVELARAMAERIVGEEIALDPAKIAVMARQTLALVKQARQIALSAHPQDAATLRAHLASLGLEQAALEIHADETRARGSLLLETDLGIIDADLTIQLDRLARSLRDGLRQ